MSTGNKSARHIERETEEAALHAALVEVLKRYAGRDFKSFTENWPDIGEYHAVVIDDAEIDVHVQCAKVAYSSGPVHIRFEAQRRGLWRKRTKEVWLFDWQGLTGNLKGDDIETETSAAGKAHFAERARIEAAGPRRTGNAKVDRWIHEVLFRQSTALGLSLWAGLALFIHGWYSEFIVSRAWEWLALAITVGVSGYAAWRVCGGDLNESLLSFISTLLLTVVFSYPGYYAVAHGVGSVVTELIGKPAELRIRAVKDVERYRRGGCRSRILLEGTELERLSQGHLCLYGADKSKPKEAADFDVIGKTSPLGLWVDYTSWVRSGPAVR